MQGRNEDHATSTMNYVTVTSRRIPMQASSAHSYKSSTTAHGPVNLGTHISEDVYRILHQHDLESPLAQTHKAQR